MKKVITFIVLLAMCGCTGLPVEREGSPSSARKAELQKCVSNFLQQDVSPVDSLHICASIYSRWEPTTTKSFEREEVSK